MTGPAVVAIGGGHGLAMTLRAVRSYAGRATAVVATGDDGGSSGRLRVDLPMPAPGDLRRCLSALADDRRLADAMEHRFDAGELAGHAVGNLVIAGLVDAGFDLSDAAAELSRWLGIDPALARVLPATSETVDLVATTPAGEVRGQVAAESAPDVVAVAFDPPDPGVPPDVLVAIGSADQIVLGPGSFFTSVLGAAAVPAVAKAVGAADCPVALVANLDGDPAQDVDRLQAHGIDVDVVVVPAGAAVDAPGVRVVAGDIIRPHGRAHDAALLGPVLHATFSTK